MSRSMEMGKRCFFTFEWLSVLHFSTFKRDNIEKENIIELKILAFYTVECVLSLTNKQENGT